MALTYTNPLWSGYCADPFVLKWQGEYYAYGTSLHFDAGRTFSLLHSKDFVHWEYLGGALEQLSGERDIEYWAPEVTEHNGKFYMYYAAEYRLRLAIADSPTGPFRDSGRLLFPEEDFSIDAHFFCDPRDGQPYLFFAKDFFDGRVGTGIVVVPLKEDLITFAEPPRMVNRASADWQIFERNRVWYGKTWEAWHTVEGPFVVEHDGLYYCLYSGGRWENDSYGMSYCVAEHPLGPYRDEWSAQGPSVLRGIPGKVIGPGHASVVKGPDNSTDFLIYHAWDTAYTARRMCLDPLIWTPQGPRCQGPTTEPQLLT